MNLQSFKDKIRIELQRRKKCNVYNWLTTARPSQLQPDGDWRIWCIIAGRGFGKTRTGAETIKLWVANKMAKRIALVGSTIEDVKKVMIEGESGLLNIHPPGSVKYSGNRLKWLNGATATIHSSNAYESLRGHQFDAAWVDELAKFPNPQETWDQLMLCMRVGVKPRTIVTTTPRPIPIINKLLARQDVVCTRGSTTENAENLSASYLEEIEYSYGGTALGLQEINGQILQSSTMWVGKMIKPWNEELPQMRCIVVGLDPAITVHGDETGIITVGQDFLGRYFVLDDASGNWTPNQWVDKVRQQFIMHNARLIVAEVNQGGDMVSSMLKDMPIKSVRASTSKIARATPIAALYEQGLVYHTKDMPMLKHQLLEFESVKSPDRVDALVWAIEMLRSLRF